MEWLLLYIVFGLLATFCLACLKNRSAGSWVLIGFVAIPAIIGLCAGPIMFAIVLGLTPVGVPLVLLCSRRNELIRPTVVSLLPVELAVPRQDRLSLASPKCRSLALISFLPDQDELSRRAAEAIKVMDHALVDAHDRWQREHHIVLELKISSGAPQGRPCADCRGWVDWSEPQCRHCGASRHVASDIIAMVRAGLDVMGARVERKFSIPQMQ